MEVGDTVEAVQWIHQHVMNQGKFPDVPAGAVGVVLDVLDSAIGVDFGFPYGVVLSLPNEIEKHRKNKRSQSKDGVWRHVYVRVSGSIRTVTHHPKFGVRQTAVGGGYPYPSLLTPDEFEKLWAEAED